MRVYMVDNKDEGLCFLVTARTGAEAWDLVKKYFPSKNAMISSLNHKLVGKKDEAEIVWPFGADRSQTSWSARVRP